MPDEIRRLEIAVAAGDALIREIRRRCAAGMACRGKAVSFRVSRPRTTTLPSAWRSATSSAFRRRPMPEHTPVTDEAVRVAQAADDQYATDTRPQTSRR